MTTPGIDIVEQPLLQGFPKPGKTLKLAYRELEQATNGTDAQKKALGEESQLARPWLPSTLTTPEQRTDLWAWLDGVVTWHNHEYVFDPADLVPTCWPRHPHLVHELAGLADQRYRAETALDGNGLEDWHRYTLPAFVERMRRRLGPHCTDTHTKWPSAARYGRHIDDEHLQTRRAAFIGDARSASKRDEPNPDTMRSGLHLVDLDTGEITD